MKIICKIAFPILIVLLTSYYTVAQQVIVNEIMFKPYPALTSNNSQAMVNVSVPTAGREYVELYNSDCNNPIDLSGWVLASEVRIAGSRIGGAICFPPGTVVPPGDFLIIGGPDETCNVAPNCQPAHAYPAGSIDFDLSDYIGTTYLCVPQNVWLLANGDGWMAVYEPGGTPHSACYWSGAASNITSTTYDGDFSWGPCSPAAYTGPALLSARQIYQQFPTIMNYMGAGTSCGMGNTFSRMPDGGPFQVRPRTIGPTRAERCNDGSCLACGNLLVTPAPDTCSAGLGALTLEIPDPAVSPGPYTYVISGPNGYSNTFTTSNIIHILTGLDAGSYTIQVSDSQSPPAVTTKTALIDNVGGNVNVIATANPAQICAGSATALTASGASTYTWSNGLGTSASVSASPTASTTYTVTGTDALGCAGTASVAVTVAGSISVSASASPQQICTGGTSQLTALGGNSYNWSNGLGTTPTVSVTPNASTTYTVTATDTQGCSGTASVAVDVLTSLTASITPANPQICQGDNLVLTAAANGNNPAFTWSTGATGASLTVNPQSTGSYTVDVQDDIGCTGNAQVTVTVNTIPQVDFTAIPEEGCAPLTVSFQNLSEQNMVYNWNFGNGQTSNLFNPVITYNAAGSFTVSLTVTNQGCVNDLTKAAYINVNLLPNADFMPSATLVDEDDSEIVFSDNSTGASSWVWNFGDGTSGVTEQSPSHSFPVQGDYTVCLFVENNWSCADSVCKDITVKPFVSFYIPNAFSPDGDGINDLFYPFGNNVNLDDFSMRIFDRWGKLQFVTTSINDGWDGTSSYDGSNNLVPTGVYTYVIEAAFFKQRRQIFRGAVVVVY